MSLGHTGTEFIAANTPVFWEAPTPDEIAKQHEIRGMPPDAVYPMIKPYSQESLATVMADALVGEFSQSGTANIKIDDTLSDGDRKKTKKIIADLIKKKVKVWRRVIGWTLNDCEPGKFFPTCFVCRISG